VNNLYLTQTAAYDLKPSLNLRTQRHLGSSEWLRVTNDIERFINLTLSLIHPELFESGLNILQTLRETGMTKDIAHEWQSVYTGISVISNRVTPSHRDRKGRPQWFDTLISYSDRSDGPQLLLNDLGLELEYCSGTVVALCGTVLKHEVRSWGDGDRVCYAHFMREEVRNKVDAPVAGWVHKSMYLSKSSSIDMELDLKEMDNNISGEMEMGYADDDFELDSEDSGDSDEDFEISGDSDEDLEPDFEEIGDYYDEF
jgi:hypothetical protein